MKKILGIAALAIMASSTASAAEYYASISGLYGKGGFKNLKDTHGDSHKPNNKPKGFDIAFGSHITPETRAELAVGYTTSNAKGQAADKNNQKFDYKIKDETISFMLNGYYDFNNSSDFTPYLTGGIGYARNKLTLRENEITTQKLTTKGGFQYQLGLGVDVKVAENVKIGVGYRFRHNLVKISGIKHKPSHLAIAQVRFEF